eukprot:CAMPEP_0184489288 /NCGR_PEP_ID=MMETSP0113_2-20130426/14976_1 /TAXON_ID=91329 /ORGANISM="Norrisiella sphaerica, Strain BC52" /LENGTH=839 /DNA_ID=CAMNT_0026872611 /DNA_START=42 /DNA_END=2561 /DNA_ORIENTATION=+
MSTPSFPPNGLTLKEALHSNGDIMRVVKMPCAQCNVLITVSRKDKRVDKGSMYKHMLNSCNVVSRDFNRLLVHFKLVKKKSVLYASDVKSADTKLIKDQNLWDLYNGLMELLDKANDLIEDKVKMNQGVKLLTSLAGKPGGNNSKSHTGNHVKGRNKPEHSAKASLKPHFPNNSKRNKMVMDGLQILHETASAGLDEGSSNAQGRWRIPQPDHSGMNSEATGSNANVGGGSPLPLQGNWRQNYNYDGEQTGSGPRKRERDWQIGGNHGRENEALKRRSISQSSMRLHSHPPGDHHPSPHGLSIEFNQSQYPIGAAEYDRKLSGNSSGRDSPEWRGDPPNNMKSDSFGNTSKENSAFWQIVYPEDPRRIIPLERFWDNGSTVSIRMLVHGSARDRLWLTWFHEQSRDEFVAPHIPEDVANAATFHQVHAALCGENADPRLHGWLKKRMAQGRTLTSHIRLGSQRFQCELRFDEGAQVVTIPIGEVKPFVAAVRSFFERAERQIPHATECTQIEIDFHVESIAFQNPERREDFIIQLSLEQSPSRTHHQSSKLRGRFIFAVDINAALGSRNATRGLGESPRGQSQIIASGVMHSQGIQHSRNQPQRPTVNSQHNQHHQHGQRQSRERHQHSPLHHAQHQQLGHQQQHQQLSRFQDQHRDQHQQHHHRQTRHHSNLPHNSHQAHQRIQSSSQPRSQPSKRRASASPDSEGFQKRIHGHQHPRPFPKHYHMLREQLTHPKQPESQRWDAIDHSKRTPELPMINDDNSSDDHLSMHERAMRLPTSKANQALATRIGGKDNLSEDKKRQPRGTGGSMSEGLDVKKTQVERGDDPPNQAEPRDGKP